MSLTGVECKKGELQLPRPSLDLARPRTLYATRARFFCPVTPVLPGALGSDHLAAAVRRPAGLTKRQITASHLSPRLRLMAHCAEACVTDRGRGWGRDECWSLGMTLRRPNPSWLAPRCQAAGYSRLGEENGAGWLHTDAGC